jgi:8-oxo-dGTP pyrophosphatase MutT (NUDIX family)
MTTPSEPSRPKYSRTRASAICVHDGKLLCVRLRDPHTRLARLFAPGGAVEPGETPREAAERETLEETGYVVIADAASERIEHYDFTWNALDLAVTTHFFRATLRDPTQAVRPVDDASYHEGVVWLELELVSTALAFDANILRAVSALL